MSNKAPTTSAGHGFGTAPVFLAAISTILGAILFLRFGYAVGHTGILGAFVIVLIGHAITIPTALAVAEIATNLKVEGGGAYYIISRSFGTTVGGTIGIFLYFSQAISVAFYMIAFAEVFRPFFAQVGSWIGFPISLWMITIPATLALLILILRKGANIGVTMLWIVVGILGLSLVMFFMGQPDNKPESVDIFARVSDPDNFFFVFAIVFPAFTGMIAGVGLSGDLKNPRRSIPLGTISATIVGMIVYFLVIFKLGTSVSPEEMASDQFVMGKIAVWGPIIFIGLAAASLSSAIGSILVAPRTLQALGNDKIFPVDRINRFLGTTKGKEGEPINAMIVTSVIAMFFLSMGGINFVAQIISMFFMITYGTLCSISFLEHFAGNPSYRPTFRSKWYLSLIGAVASFIMMFQMQPFYAMLSVVMMVVIYIWLSRSQKGQRHLSEVVKGVLFQMTRQLQVLIQKEHAILTTSNWRPSFIAISSHSLDRLASFELLKWISHHYGFGMFIHFIQGPLNKKTNEHAKCILQQLIGQIQASKAGLYVDTIVSPSFRTAVAQIVQIPGISGMDNNSIMFEFHKQTSDDIIDIIDGMSFAVATDFNVCVLRSSERHFGYKRKIHIWLTPGDYRNANLMIVLSYIIIGHPEWKGSEIELFAAFRREEMTEEVQRLNDLIARGRIPISVKNVRQIPFSKDMPFDQLVSQYSVSADLVVTGFSYKKVKEQKGEFFQGFSEINDILFVRAGQEILITDDSDE
ncbi:MAG: amino acid permease [Candidatus Electryoneaceae bacterium]|nr:amino acid permease [Candidatus Electryoneaceae bacterium]